MQDSPMNQSVMVENLIREAHPDIPTADAEIWRAACNKSEAERDELKALLLHIFIHSGYGDCGFHQMTTPQKRRFVALLREGEQTETAARLEGWIDVDTEQGSRYDKTNATED